MFFCGGCGKSDQESSQCLCFPLNRPVDMLCVYCGCFPCKCSSYKKTYCTGCGRDEDSPAQCLCFVEYDIASYCRECGYYLFPCQCNKNLPEKYCNGCAQEEKECKCDGNWSMKFCARCRQEFIPHYHRKDSKVVLPLLRSRFCSSRRRIKQQLASPRYAWRKMFSTRRKLHLTSQP
jgi:hypothetical protein